MTSAASSGLSVRRSTYPVIAAWFAAYICSNLAVTYLRNSAPIGVPMRSQPTAMPGQQGASPVSPVIAGGTWLGDDGPGQSLTLQLKLPISAEELTAAQYEDDQLCPADLVKDENVWGFAAVAIVQDGLNAIQHHRDEILVAEAPLGSPATTSTRQ
jgi:hypothetical protein